MIWLREVEESCYTGSARPERMVFPSCAEPRGVIFWVFCMFCLSFNHQLTN